MRYVWLWVVICSLLPAAAFGQDTELEPVDVAFVGIVSPDMTAAESGPIANELDEAIFRLTASALSREATMERLRTNEVVAQACINAVGAKKAGAKALEALNLEEAEKQLRQSGGYFRQCHGTWTSPAAVADLYVLRAMVEFGKRDEGATYAALTRALPTHPTKKLDAAVYPPEVVKMFDRAVLDATARVPKPPVPEPLVDVANRVKAKWVIQAEVRRGAQEIRMLINIVDRGGDLSSKRIALPVVGERGDAIDAGLREAFLAAGIPSSAVAMVTPTPTNGRTVPDQALPDPTRPTPVPVGKRPLYKRWYVWAAAATAAVVAGGFAASQSSGPGPNPTPTLTPPPAGITIVVEP